jgi:hypothetical protein
VGHACNLSYLGSRERRIEAPGLGKVSTRVYLKNKAKKNGGGLTQVIEHLPRKQEAFSTEVGKVIKITGKYTDIVPVEVQSNKINQDKEGNFHSQ